MNAGIAQIPLAVGAGAASMVGHALSWSFARFARSPMASTGLVLIAGLTLMAATNALFLQDTRHPAPLFVSGSDGAASRPVPIEPVVVEPLEIPQRPVAQPVAPEPVPAASQTSTPVSEAPEPTIAAIGNQDIADLQEKLKAMGIFDGTVDGYYGPRTADAIRDFEARFNLPRTGAATPQVIKAVREAPLQTSQAAQPAPVAATPQADEIAPLLAQMQETAPTVTDTVERQTVADISPNLSVSTPQASAETAQPSVPAVLNGDLVSDIQRGLSRLGFLQGPVNGVADEATARAIRQFQIFNNYRPTGEVSPVLRQMLVEAGAFL
ncbi:peptidoglycan-binding protein [Pelagibacterium sp.]|uniref:peptidoglycan-binding protein n=1 Tax=Pelagibacterium sp. TaxID=1967288 RepID=UPI003BACF720